MLDKFENLNLRSLAMEHNGKEEADRLFFIWIHKKVFAKLILKLDHQGFEYIENLSWIKLNKKLVKGHETNTHI